ncbi:hypothetical protein HK104_005087 [Borealophlyctis nickersoniae]|nr:hypothetical protein HK104_005087 [Borealophlyctis nickersoniae]
MSSRHAQVMEQAKFPRLPLSQRKLRAGHGEGRRARSRAGGGRVSDACPQRKLAQFEHYAALVQLFTKLGGFPGDLYVIFTDDDDFWHPDRAAAYWKVYSTFVRGEGAPAEPVPYELAGILDARERVNAYSWEEVDSLVRAGTLHFDKAGFPDDYVALCVPFTVLKEYVAKCSPTLLQHRYCDVCFFTYVRALHGNMFLGQPAHWTYFYRFDETRPQSALEVEHIRRGDKGVLEVKGCAEVEAIKAAPLCKTFLQSSAQYFSPEPLGVE